MHFYECFHKCFAMAILGHQIREILLVVVSLTILKNIFTILFIIFMVYELFRDFISLD